MAGPIRGTNGWTPTNCGHDGDGGPATQGLSASSNSSSWIMLRPGALVVDDLSVLVVVDVFAEVVDVLRSRVGGHEVVGDLLELAVLGLLLLEDATGHAVDDLSVGQDGDGEGILAVGELEHASGLDGDEGI